MTKKETKLGVAVGVTRALALGVGSAALETSGGGQVLGYFLALLGLPEVLLIRGLRDQRIVWTVAGVVLVFVGSFVWVAVVSRVLRSSRRQGTPRSPGPGSDDT